MRFKNIILISVLLGVSLIQSCDLNTPEALRDNPLDQGNPQTGGDPFELQAEIAGGGIRLTWNIINLNSVIGYNIYRKVDNTASFSLLVEIENANISVYVDVNVINGHTYSYYIVVKGANGEESSSNLATVTIHNSPLLAIEDENGFTANRQVNLTLLAVNATMMQVGTPDLTQADWSPYTTSSSITLQTGTGVKIVQARFAYSNGDTSAIVSDSTNPLPMNPSVIINNDSLYTFSRQVILNLTASGALWIRIFNDSISTTNYSNELEYNNMKLRNNINIIYTWTDNDWLPFVDSLAWVLNSGDGVKTVFVEFKNDFEIVENAFDEILPTPLENIDFNINHNSTYTAMRNVWLFTTAEGANLQCKYSEDSLFTSVAWQAFYDSTSFTLSSGDSIKTVYALIKNDFEVESDTISDSIEPLAMNPTFNIAHNAQYTPARQVWLFPSAGGYNLQCIFSEDSVFSGANWQSLTDSSIFILSIEDGIKTIYAKFKNDFEIESPVISDDIEPLPMNPSFNIAHNAQYTPTRQVWLFPNASGVNLQGKFSEDYNFTGINWQNLTDSISFILSYGEEAKTVYGLIKNDFEIVSSLLSDQIEIYSLYPNLNILPDSTYINHSNVTLSMPNVGAWEMKLNIVDDSSQVPWEPYKETVNNFDLGTGDGLKFAYAWFKNDFYTAGPVKDSIWLDTQCSVDTFYWLSNSGQILNTGDTLTICLIMNYDAIGIEVGGTAKATLGNIFNNLNLNDNGNGSYDVDYIIQIDDYIENGNLTADFTDRARNSVSNIANGNPLNIAIDWTKTYGGIADDKGEELQLTSDGGYIIVGSTESFGAGLSDIYLIKTDEDGNELWHQTYGGDGNDFGYSVHLTSDGGYIIAGYTESYGTGGEVYLVKTDALGNENWHQTYGGSGHDEGRSVQQTSDGGYIITGLSWANNSWQVYLVKTDNSGNMEWSHLYGGNSTDKGYSVRQTTDYGYIITGKTSSSGAGGYDVYLIKTDISGDTLWTKTYGDIGNDCGYCVRQTLSGDYIVAGSIEPSGSAKNLYLISVDLDGDLVWQQNYNYGSESEAYSVIETDNGFAISGYFSTGSNRGIILLTTNPFGAEIMHKNFDYPGWEEGKSLVQTPIGRYVIAGYTNSFGAGGTEMFLVNTNGE